MHIYLNPGVKNHRSKGSYSSKQSVLFGPAKQP
jgi:hypothetical protein